MSILKLKNTQGQWEEVPAIKGSDGVSPDLQIGTVETLPAGSDATASITGTQAEPLLNLGIPKGADGTTINVDPTLSVSGDAADAKVTGDYILSTMSLFTKLDNVVYIVGVISRNNGYRNADDTSKNVCSDAFYKVNDYVGVEKVASESYSMDIYFYTSASWKTFVKSKNQINIDRYIFTDDDADLYFRVQIRSTNVLDTSTRYANLLTNRKASVAQKNEDKKNAIVASKGKTQSNFTLLVCTDIHGDDVRMLNVINYLNDMDEIDAGACLGDISASNYATNCDFYKNAVLNAKKDFFTVIGNHDAGNGTEVAHNGTQQQIFNKFIAPVVEKTGTETETSYYYKDYAAPKVRVIILNSSDMPDTLVDESTFAVSHGTLGAFSQAQIDWLISTLNDTPSNYHVVILMHHINAMMTVDGNVHFQSLSAGTQIGENNNAYLGIIPDIVSAWVSGGTLSQTYESTVDDMPTLTVDADFTLRGTGIFVGVLSGHKHRDIIGKFDNYPTQNACIFTISNMARGTEDNMPRIEGEKSEDCMTVVSIDTTNRKLYLVRVGANLSIDFEYREDTCINY